MYYKSTYSSALKNAVHYRFGPSAYADLVGCLRKTDFKIRSYNLDYSFALKVAVQFVTTNSYW